MQTQHSHFNIENVQSPKICLTHILQIVFSWALLIHNVHLYFMITKVLLIHNCHLCLWSSHTKASFDPLLALCLHDHQSFNKTLVIQSFNISQSSCNLCLCIAHVSFVEYKLTYLFNNAQDHKNAHSKMEKKRSKIKLIREIFNHYTQVDHSCQNLEKKLCREISSHMFWQKWFNSMDVLLQKTKLCLNLSHTT